MKAKTTKRKKVPRLVRISAPVSRASEVESLIDAGANELYCGVLTARNLDNQPGFNCINRRSEITSNLTGFKELSKVVKLAHKRNVSVSFTLNEYYTQPQLNDAIDQLERAVDCSVDNIIVADTGLLHFMEKMKSRKFNLHISSCAAAFNSETIRFYRQFFNPERIIIQRHLTLPEFRNLRGNFPELQFEVFILNERCVNIDGFCTFLHTSFMSSKNFFSRILCNQTLSKAVLKYVPRIFLDRLHSQGVSRVLPCCFKYRETGSRGSGSNYFNDEKLFLKACAACFLYDFYEMGISHFKISGRSFLANKIRDAGIIREAVMEVSRAYGREEFYEKARSIVKKHKRVCGGEYCYYTDEQG